MATFDRLKLLLPVIRKVYPDILANEICSVQPMTGPTGSVFTMKTSYKPDYEYLLYKNYPKIENNMIVAHTSIRPFMRKDEPEPNTHYRPWLEEHIGVQGINWDWRVKNVTDNLIAIDFVDKEHAILFELSWQ